MRRFVIKKFISQEHDEGGNIQAGACLTKRDVAPELEAQVVVFDCVRSVSLEFGVYPYNTEDITKKVKARRRKADILLATVTKWHENYMKVLDQLVIDYDKYKEKQT